MHPIVQRCVCIKLFEPAILFLQLFEAPELLAVHAGVLLLPAVEGRQRNAQLAADVLGRAAGFVFLKRAADLCFRESLAFHGCTKLRLPIRSVIWEAFTAIVVPSLQAKRRLL